MQAIQSGDAEGLRALLAADPSLAASRDEMGVSALLQSLYRRRSDMVETLLRCGPQLDVFEAAALGHKERLAELLASDPSLATAWSADGFTPLHYAAYFGQPESARFLIERGARPETARNPMRVSPLHSAVSARHLEVAAVLLAHGADPDARQQEGWTPLQGAAHNGDAAMVRLLLDHGADPSLAADNGKTALEVAREAGREAVVDLMQAARRGG
jgi:ankyrin repeat protein